MTPRPAQPPRTPPRALPGPHTGDLGDLAGLEAALLQHYGREPETLELIASAGVLWRRGREATTRLDAEGLTVQVGRGLFKHPLVTVEREARLGFLAILRALEERSRRRKIGGPTRVEQLTRPPALSRRARKYLTFAQDA